MYGNDAIRFVTTILIMIITVILVVITVIQVTDTFILNVSENYVVVAAKRRGGRQFALSSLPVEPPDVFTTCLIMENTCNNTYYMHYTECLRRKGPFRFPNTVSFRINGQRACKSCVGHFLEKKFKTKRSVLRKNLELATSREKGRLYCQIMNL